ncbi:hypothetical protein BLS_005689 [Venturia inaequalis]|uniref:Cytochrome P450 n=1 Tax=Venturia inaequalis TaxID=5025 RepID=A0A8H3VDL7_VENIN|nr:hypothetical protein BLS_005689 [Venturia inaequalis]
MFESMISWQSIAAVFILWIVYHILVALYRVTYHPLTAFPGPKLAALSYKYEFYFDGILGGQYTAEISRMHEKYGPIVRINPEELHCNDPGFVDQIYPGGGERRDKSAYHVAQFGAAVSLAGIGSVHHNLHRLRRGALNRFFSKAAIVKIEPLVHTLAQKLCDKLLARSKDGRPAFNISMAYSCFTTDIITRYCFGQSYGYLDQEEFEPNLGQAIVTSVAAGAFVKQWPFLFTIMDSTPDYVAKLFSANLKEFIVYQANLRKHVKKIKRMYIEDKKKAIEGDKSIFGELLESSLPENEKTVERLGAESSVLIGAGTETTNAVILESIRLSYGAATRLPRVSPDKDLYYNGLSHEYIIPKGTPVGMTSVIMHANEAIFPQAAVFMPERWLRDDGTRRTELEKYLMSFSKGSRICLGMNLAYCELYILLAALVLKVFPRLKLFETTVEDVEFHHDMFLPMTKPESLGVRVLIE